MISGVADVTQGAPSRALAVVPVAAARSLALPPYLAAVTASDPDGDGDNDLGTIVDTFA
jgi:hypothetical protein